MSYISTLVELEKPVLAYFGEKKTGSPDFQESLLSLLLYSKFYFFTSSYSTSCASLPPELLPPVVALPSAPAPD